MIETRSLIASARQNDVGEGAFHEIWLNALIVNNLRGYNTGRVIVCCESAESY